MNCYTATDALNETEGELEAARNRLTEQRIANRNLLAALKQAREELAEARRINAKLREIVIDFANLARDTANEALHQEARI